MRIQEISTKLGKLQNQSSTYAHRLSERSLQSELWEVLKRKDMRWPQKLRETWLKDGNRNSKFFHLFTVVCSDQTFVHAIQTDS